MKPDSVRRHYGAVIAEQLLGALRELSPDLLRWHLPRRGHGAGDLLAGLLVPLAEFTDGMRQLTLAAATPQFALDAGQRIVLVLLGGHEDGATRAVLEGVRTKHAPRLSLVRHRMFWSADAAPGLAALCDTTADTTAEITQLQESGSFAEAWHAAGFDLRLPESRRRARWLAALPIRISGLAERVREALPGVDEAVARSGVGALVLSGLNSTAVASRPSPIVARVAEDGDALGLPIVPNAVWSRVLDADLVRFSHLGAHELHPLIASAILDAPQPGAPEPDEWLYREVPFIAGPCHAIDGAVGVGPALWITCGTTHHRIAFHDDAWHILDHLANPGRESLMARLGGPTNPCQQALDYLASGRHVMDLAESLLAHGRTTDVRNLLHTHAGAHAALTRMPLPTGGTVAEALTTLAENTLRHRMALADATRSRPQPNRRLTRKGAPARTHR
jgi:hypothetical protein